jgi:bifunctional DNase/RNase
MLVEMKIKGLAVDPSSNTPIVLLTDRDEHYVVPIWIGLLEASAIATEMEKVDVPRPMTHDLLMRMLTELGAKIERIVVHDLQEGTFLARVHVRAGEREILFDARPSDSIALALRAEASIWMEDAVIAAAAVREDSEEGEGGGKKNLEEMTLDDFPTKFKM